LVLIFQYEVVVTNFNIQRERAGRRIFIDLQLGKKNLKNMTKSFTRDISKANKVDVNNIRIRKHVMTYAVKMLSIGNTQGCTVANKSNDIDLIQSVIAIREFTNKSILEAKKSPRKPKHETTPSPKEKINVGPNIRSFSFSRKVERHFMVPALWNFRCQDCVIALSVDEKVCHIGTSNGDLFSLDRDTSRILNHYKFPESGVSAISSRTGGSLQVALKNRQVYDLALDYPRLVFTSTKQTEELQSIDYHYGYLALSFKGGAISFLCDLEQEKWSGVTSTSNGSSEDTSKVVKILEDSIVHSRAGTICVYKPEGSMIWSRDLKNGDIQSACVAENTIFVATANKKVIKLDRRTGAIRTSFTLDASPCSCTVDIMRRILYIGDCEGAIYSYDIKSGLLLWKLYTTLPFADKKSILNMKYSHRQLFITTESGYCSAINVREDAIVQALKGKGSSSMIWNSSSKDINPIIVSSKKVYKTGHRRGVIANAVIINDIVRVRVVPGQADDLNLNWNVVMPFNAEEGSSFLVEQLIEGDNEYNVIGDVQKLEKNKSVV
jgi:outer membrane protein assembly factor BamB